MANTYTPKLNLAKPAHGDVDWHIPVNGNWDKIDTELDKALKISGTTIDADKNWNGKNITNVGQVSADTVHGKLYAAKFSSEASDNVIMTFTTDWMQGDENSVTDLITCTMPSTLQAGSKLRLSATSTLLSSGNINIRVLINGTQVYEGESNYDCTVNPGQVLKLQGIGGLRAAGHKLTGQIKGTLLPIIELSPPNWSQR